MSLMTETFMFVKYSTCDICNVVKRIIAVELPIRRGCVHVCADCAKEISAAIEQVNDTDTRTA